MSYALLFPGQGAQAVGMGKELARSFPAAGEIFTQADEILKYPLSQLCWEGPAEVLTRTEHCQPALYVTSLAVWAALKSTLGDQSSPVQPVAAAGLSLGEYTALAAAGSISFDDGLGLVRLRGQAMELAARAEPGTMASVLGLEQGVLEALCTQAGAQVANLNSPGQIVISGTVQSVKAASSLALEAGARRVIPLEVSGAFHSRLMQPAADQLRTALEGVEIRSPHFPVLSNVTGCPHADPARIRQLLVEQLTQPVRWMACMQTLLNRGIQSFLELGSGSVLKGLTRKIDSKATVVSIGTPEEVRQAAASWPPRSQQGS